MLFLRQASTLIRHAAAVLVVGLIFFSSTFIGSAYAAEPVADASIATDSDNLALVAECIPTQLSEGNLDRALRESKNDFLEKVFGVKQNYDDYKLDTTEVEFLECLKRKGITPQVNQPQV